MLKLIVIPMTIELKDLMMTLQIASECELFCNDLVFRFYHSDIKDNKRDHEDYDENRCESNEMKKLIEKNTY